MSTESRMRPHAESTPGEGNFRMRPPLEPAANLTLDVASGDLTPNVASGDLTLFPVHEIIRIEPVERREDEIRVNDGRSNRHPPIPEGGTHGQEKDH
jgi:hypothetical protein